MDSTLDRLIFSMIEKALDYFYHEDSDIHEFKPYTSSRKVIDTYINVLDRIMPETIEQEKPCALIMWNLKEAEMFPLRLQNAYFKQMVEKYPNIPKAYIAYITDRTSDTALIHANYSSDRKDTREIFPTAEYNKAIQWLVECRQKMQDNS